MSVAGNEVPNRGVNQKDAAGSTSSASSKRRKPGRPRGSDDRGISSERIVATGYRLAKTVNLQDISIVLVARTMGVTPALVHYYLKGRDHLTSGVMNLFYRKMFEKLPKPSESWEADLLEASCAMYGNYLDRPGIATYCLINNRFRTFQITEEGEEDYGASVLEYYTELVMNSGCGPERAGLYSHLLRDFIMTSAYAAASDRYPATHKGFLERKVASLEQRRFPAIYATLRSQLALSADTAFLEGCRLFIAGLRSHPSDADWPRFE